jgi:hypothetical protein
MLPLFYAIGTSGHFQMTMQNYKKYLICANILNKIVKKNQYNARNKETLHPIWQRILILEPERYAGHRTAHISPI